jgi:hypothetical protein
MKAGVLCNGNSRSLFSSVDGYDYLIGCNIPWRQVDANVILDIQVVQKWYKQKELINAPTYFSEPAWRETRFKERKFFEPYFLGLVKQLPEHDSCGHVACRKVIELGYIEIDIYGCDSWFEYNNDSNTHQWVDSRSIDSKKQIDAWRKNWNKIIDNHPDVKINFIGENK